MTIGRLPSIEGGIQPTIVDAKGDLITATAADTPARIAVGADNTVLTADSSTATGLKWATPSGGDTYTAGKNKIINGAMQVAQRGTSFSFPSGGGTRYYGADRWFTEDYTWSSGSNLTVSNDSTVFPDGFSRSLKVATGATALTMGSGGSIYINQNIEGFNIASLYKSTSVTISFYVRSSVTGTYSVLFTNNTWQTAAPTRGLIKEYTVNTANTWERKTITIDLAAGTSAGTWNTNASIGLSLQFNLGANANRVGNSYLNTWATWSAYEVQSTSSVQWTSNANATFYLTGVQLEEGATATNFQTATGTISGELAACQRYYWRTSGGSVYTPILTNAFAASSTGTVGLVSFPTAMRIVPGSIDFANIAFFNYADTRYTLSAVALNSAQSSTTAATVSGTISGATAGHTGRWLADNNTAGYIGFSAEL
jgi:hypothetical protein